MDLPPRPRGDDATNKVMNLEPFSDRATHMLLTELALYFLIWTGVELRVFWQI